MKRQSMFNIPDLDEVLEAQKDLSALCAERPLQTSEVFHPNAWYGFAHVMKLYAGIPLEQPLKVVFPHGIVLNRDYVWDAEAKAPLPGVLVFPPYLMESYRRKCRFKVCIPSPSPFIYLMELMKRAGYDRPVERKGTLFFPIHSTPLVPVVTDDESAAQWLTSLPSHFHPIRVCIYWHDFLKGRHIPYLRAGLEIVSAGHIHDPAFAFRLYWLLKIHRYAMSNEVGSHLFYAVAMGSVFSLIEQEHRVLDPGGETSYNQGGTLPKEMKKIRDLFSGVQDYLSEEQNETVRWHLGAHLLLSPEEAQKAWLNPHLWLYSRNGSWKEAMRLALLWYGLQGYSAMRRTVLRITRFLKTVTEK